MTADPTRRSVLLAGLLGLGAVAGGAALTGCSLRLESDPAVRAERARQEQHSALVEVFPPLAADLTALADQLGTLAHPAAAGLADQHRIQATLLLNWAGAAPLGPSSAPAGSASPATVETLREQELAGTEEADAATLAPLGDRERATGLSVMAHRYAAGYLLGDGKRFALASGAALPPSVAMPLLEVLRPAQYAIDTARAQITDQAALANLARLADALTGWESALAAAEGHSAPVAKPAYPLDPRPDTPAAAQQLITAQCNNVISAAGSHLTDALKAREARSLAAFLGDVCGAAHPAGVPLIAFPGMTTQHGAPVATTARS